MTPDVPTLPGMEPPAHVPGRITAALDAMLAGDPKPLWADDPLTVATVRAAVENVERAESERSSWAVANALRNLTSVMAKLDAREPAGGRVDALPDDTEKDAWRSIMDDLAADAAAG